MAVSRFVRLTAVCLGAAWPASSLLAGAVAQFIPPGADSIALYHSPVLAGSERVIAGVDTLEAGRDYRFAPDYTWFKLAAAYADTVWLNYQVLDGFAQVVRRFAPVDPTVASGPTRAPPGQPSAAPTRASPPTPPTGAR